MKVSTLLKKTRKIIAKEENWTRDADARAANGNAIGVHTQGACAYCVGGALQKAYGDHYLIGNTTFLKAARLLHEDAQRYGFQGFVHANDSAATTHKQVLRAIDRCIEVAKKEEFNA